MGSREDDDYWNERQWFDEVSEVEASCYVHGGADMEYDPVEEEWICWDCEDDKENLGAYKNG